MLWIDERHLQSTLQENINKLYFRLSKRKIFSFSFYEIAAETSYFECDRSADHINSMHCRLVRQQFAFNQSITTFDLWDSIEPRATPSSRVMVTGSSRCVRRVLVTAGSAPYTTVMHDILCNAPYVNRCLALTEPETNKGGCIFFTQIQICLYFVLVIF